MTPTTSPNEDSGDPRDVELMKELKLAFDQYIHAPPSVAEEALRECLRKLQSVSVRRAIRRPARVWRPLHEADLLDWGMD